MPGRVVEPLREHLNRVRQIWNADRAAGLPGVYLPHALEKKYPTAGAEWGWQWVFPAAGLSIDPRSEIRRRHHMAETTIQGR